MRWVGLAMLLASGCLHDNLLECGGGFVCSASQVCDDVHHVCIDPEQATACNGLAAGAPCSAGSIVGLCIDGVCLEEICGDRVVEGTEVCDDGNHSNNDGCNATCTSSERCSDGILDSARGETCDDANLISGDGCDSQCAAETEEWTIEGLGPVFSTFTPPQGHVTYDTLQHKIIYVIGRVAAPVTWTWTGDRWELLSTTGLPNLDTWFVDFDPDSGGAFLFGIEVTSTHWITHVFRFQGDTWVEDPASGMAPPAELIIAAAYDSTAKRHFVITYKGGVNSGWMLDAATATWTPLPLPVPGGGARLAFDATRGKMIAVGAKTYEWNGVGWDEFNVSPPGSFFLVFDPAVGGVISVGGSTTYEQTIAKWNGATWEILPFSLPTAVAGVDAVYDVSRSRLCVLGGSIVDAVLEWDGNTWSQQWGGPTPPDANRGAAIYDVALRRLTLGVPHLSRWETWVLDSSRRRVDDAYVSNAVKTVAYDPERGHVVAISGYDFDSDDLIEQLVGDHWELIHATESTEANLRAQTMTYDPVRRALVGVDISLSTGQLPQTVTEWERFSTDQDNIANSPIAVPSTMAFDPRTSSLIVSVSYSGRSFELVGSTWTATLSPAEFYTVVTDQRRGSVFLIGPGSKMWERTAGTWSERSGPPIYVVGTSTYDPIHGELIIVGFADLSWVIARRRFVGPHPLESCNATEDVDGDGLAGCDDPECWWACGTCPPYTMCP